MWSVQALKLLCITMLKAKAQVLNYREACHHFSLILKSHLLLNLIYLLINLIKSLFFLVKAVFKLCLFYAIIDKILESD